MLNRLNLSCTAAPPSCHWQLKALHFHSHQVGSGLEAGERNHSSRGICLRKALGWGHNGSFRQAWSDRSLCRRLQSCQEGAGTAESSALPEEQPKRNNPGRAAPREPTVPAGAPGCVTSVADRQTDRQQLCPGPQLSFPAGMCCLVFTQPRAALCMVALVGCGEPFLGDPASTTVFSSPLCPGLLLSSDGRLL